MTVGKRPITMLIMATVVALASLLFTPAIAQAQPLSPAFQAQGFLA